MAIDYLSRRNFIKWSSAIGISGMLPAGTPLAAPYRQPPQNALVNLRIMNTTDLHANMMSYDYYADRSSLKSGFSRTATLIRKARAGNRNSILVDNGDTIQGTPLATYIHKRGLRDGETHPIINAMNKMGYDVATLGNHEFDYGLKFLNQTLSGANFPYVVSNAYSADTGKPYFRQYIIKDFPVTTESGDTVTIRVGFIGLVTPQITIWDQKYLNGKIVTRDIIDTASKLIPEMKMAGADIIIALAHSGLSTNAKVPLLENAAYYLSQLPDITGVVAGHQHMFFPGKDFSDIPDADLRNGTINGVPVTMAGCFGSALGVMDMSLSYRDNRWQILNAQAHIWPVYDSHTKTVSAEVDEDIAAIFAPYHQGSREIVNMRIGRSATDICSYLSMLQNTAALQIINEAQIHYVRNDIQSIPELASLPLISSAASYKTGSQNSDPDNFVNIEKGELLFRHAVELYPFGNCVSLLKVSGKELKEWLECAASIFNQITDTTTPQDLINQQGFKDFNFDVFYGIEYEIDIYQPPRYSDKYQLLNPDAQRICNLKYQGGAISDDSVFLVASNSHRAHEGLFPGTGNANIVFDSTDENRLVIAEYMKYQSAKSGKLEITVKDNWSFVPITSKSTLDIRFYSSPTRRARQIIEQHAFYGLRYSGKAANGFGIYTLSTLQKRET